MLLLNEITKIFMLEILIYKTICTLEIFCCLDGIPSETGFVLKLLLILYDICMLIAI